MAEPIDIRRRALIQGALAGAATLPAAMTVGATTPLTLHEKIHHHATELRRLIQGCAPEGVTVSQFGVWKDDGKFHCTSGKGCAWIYTSGKGWAPAGEELV